MKIIWSPSALSQLRSWVEYIARDSIARANKERTKLFKSVKRLEKFPRSGRIVPEFGIETLREIIKPPIRIIYRILMKETQILALHHDHQELDSKLFGK